MRRDKGEGSITKRKDGRFEARLTVGKDIRSFYGTTKREALKKMRDVKTQIITDNYVKPNRQTVKEWFSVWLETYKKNQVRPSTYATYESRIRTHIYPEFGDVQLQKITTHDIQEFYTKLFASCRADKKPGGLSPRTIKHIHVLLYIAFKKAYELELINKNPVKNTLPPSTQPSRQEIFTREEQTAFENVVNYDRWGIACLLTLYAGLRVGEVLGLHWDDIDLENQFISVQRAVYRTDVDGKSQNLIQPPKTKKGERTIPIPSHIVDILKTFKKTTDSNIVFHSRVGGYTESRNLTKNFHKLLNKAGIKRKTFHSLRHTYVSRLIEENVNLKIIQELVGHMSINTTMDIYGHIGEKVKFEAVQKLNNIFNQSNNQSD